MAGLNNKKPPYSEEAEMELLGAMVLQDVALYKAIEILQEDDFYFEKHRKIFRAIRNLFERKSEVSLVSLKEELRRAGELENVGGAEYLANMVESVISPSLVDDYIQIVLEKAIYRQIINVCIDVLEKAYKEDIPAEELLDYAEHKILDIRQNRITVSFQHIGDMIHDIFSMINDLMLHRRHITGIPSGFENLDRMTSGFHPGEFAVIASRPSMGKTSLALNIMRYLGVEKGIPSAIFSLEMSREQLVMRFLSMESGVSFQALRTGFISQDRIQDLTDAVKKLRDAPIFIDDTPSIHILELKAKARRIVKEENVKIIFVDYLQLVRGFRAENKVQEIAGISQALKSLAKELKIPVVALSQLSRAPEHRREDRRPRLADLRESGSIEQDADLVLFIFRPEIYYQDPSYEGLAEIIIGKQRNGPQGTVRLAFIKDVMRFEQYAGYEAGEYVPGEESYF